MIGRYKSECFRTVVSTCSILARHIAKSSFFSSSTFLNHMKGALLRAVLKKSVICYRYEILFSTKMVPTSNKDLGDDAKPTLPLTIIEGYCSDSSVGTQPIQ